MYNFKAKEITNQCIAWIQDWFKQNGRNCKAVIGISGGKDSTIVAALCVKALGAENVIGVLMPDGEQKDFAVAENVCKHLGIESITINIQTACLAIQNPIRRKLTNWSEQSNINLPPRIRMATLYAVSQTINGRVINTCNLSENHVGYATRYGDSVGDMSPLSLLTVTEVKAIGYELRLPKEFIEKIPSDGLCDKTDEDNLGFSYDTLDKYLREHIEPEPETKQRIDNLFQKNEFKLKPMPAFQPDTKYLYGE